MPETHAPVLSQKGSGVFYRTVAIHITFPFLTPGPSGKLCAAMLTIANRRFQLLSPFSGLSVSLAPNAISPKQQLWSLHTYWVPEEDDPFPLPWEGPRVWHMSIPTLGLRVSHWHDLKGMEMDPEDLSLLTLGASVQDIATHHSSDAPVLSLSIWSLRFISRTGYRFIVEMDGEVPPQDSAVERKAQAEETSVLSGDFRLRVEVPFYEAAVCVPLNAADPLATAASIARREVGLSAHARHQVNLFDPNRRVWKPIENSHHSVLLETPWRG